MSVNSKMTTLADEIRELSGATDLLGLNEMAVHIAEANDEISDQTELLTQLANALQGKGQSSGGTNTSDATATADDIVIGETAYVNGVKLTGTNPYEKEATDTTISAQANLISQVKAVLQNKVANSGVELPSLTNPASQSDVLNGKEFIDANGNKITGNFDITTPLAELNAINGGTSASTISEAVDNTEAHASSQEALIAQIAEALEGKAAGGGSSDGGAVKTCTITITLDRSAELYVYGTLYSEGEFSAYDANGQSPSATYVFNNVVCGSMLNINPHYYTTVPAYTLGGGITLLNRNNGAFQAPTEAGANGTIRIIDDE